MVVTIDFYSILIYSKKNNTVYFIDNWYLSNKPNNCYLLNLIPHHYCWVFVIIFSLHIKICIHIQADLYMFMFVYKIYVVVCINIKRHVYGWTYMDIPNYTYIYVNLYVANVYIYTRVHIYLPIRTSKSILVYHI